MPTLRKVLVKSLILVAMIILLSPIVLTKALHISTTSSSYEIIHSPSSVISKVIASSSNVFNETINNTLLIR